jgi:acyl carrier protein
VIRILVSVTGRPRGGRAALRLPAAVAGLAGDPGDYRFPHPRASVTHTPHAGAAAVLLDGPAAGIGVDLEHDRPVSPRMARFYLHDDELTQQDLLRLWTVKEAMFKADPGNHDRMLRDYRADDPGYPHVSTRILGGWLTVAARLARSRMTTSAITFDAVAGRIAAVLNVPESRLTPGTTLQDLAADSFLLVEMIVDLQEEFDAAFTQASLREVGNLGELVELLRATST